jgi:O-antigen ligase
MGVVVVPVLFWDFLANQAGPLHNRRTIALVLSVYLLYMSAARAAILATAVTALVMCAVLRRYRLLLHSGFVIFVLIVAIGAFSPARFDSLVGDVTSSVIYKKSIGRSGPFEGAFASRLGPWQEASAAINKHPWFGTGFGTSNLSQRPRVRSEIYSMAGTHREHANSYLAIVAYVGLAGIIPFAVLMLLLTAKLTQLYRSVLRSGEARQPFVPIAMVVLAGLIHAIFEDWLFAPGYYLCIFFWALAFQLMDFAPAAVVDLAHFTFRPAPASRQAVPPASAARLPAGLGS